MATALLAELKDYLNRLADDGESNSIDLHSLPMTDADINELADHLGVGEVKATINSIGSSSIRETAYRGIWWVTHYGDDSQVLSELIEITRIPEILVTHEDEIRHSARAMAAL
jgi:hydrogenase-1 operon protein HyaF